MALPLCGEVQNRTTMTLSSVLSGWGGMLTESVLISCSLRQPRPRAHSFTRDQTFSGVLQEALTAGFVRSSAKHKRKGSEPVIALKQPGDGLPSLANLGLSGLL